MAGQPPSGTVTSDAADPEELLEPEPSEPLTLSLEDWALTDSVLKSPTLEDSVLNESELNDSELCDPALNETLLEDSALSDAELDDTSLNETLLEDSAPSDSLLTDSVAEDSVPLDAEDSKLLATIMELPVPCDEPVEPAEGEVDEPGVDDPVPLVGPLAIVEPPGVPDVVPPIVRPVVRPVELPPEAASPAPPSGMPLLDELVADEPQAGKAATATSSGRKVRIVLRVMRAPDRSFGGAGPPPRVVEPSSCPRSRAMVDDLST